MHRIIVIFNYNITVLINYLIQLTYLCCIEPPQLFVDSTKKISQEVVQYKTVILPEPVSNVTLIPGDAAITFVKDGQKMTTFELTSTAELNQVCAFHSDIVY